MNFWITIALQPTGCHIFLLKCYCTEEFSSCIDLQVTLSKIYSRNKTNVDAKWRHFLSCVMCVCVCVLEDSSVLRPQLLKRALLYTVIVVSIIDSCDVIAILDTFCRHRYMYDGDILVSSFMWMTHRCRYELCISMFHDYIERQSFSLMSAALINVAN
jgi:hypothetical protein